MQRYSLGDLELMYDGRIPDEMRAAAVQSHAPLMYAPKRRAPLPKVRRKPASAEDMAGVLLERAAANGSCSEDDLLAAGFTQREIARLGPKAVERASAFQMECE